jgi:hypothetical protein
MTETQRVPAPRVPLKGRPDLALIIIVSLITILVTKPWGSTAPPNAALESTPPAEAPTSAPTPVEEGYAFDQAVFGNFKPKPEWSIWPAGFFVTVRYVTRETDAAAPSGTTPPPTRSPSASPGASAEPGWPALVTIGPGDHLLWLGIDVPVDWEVRDAHVWRLGSGGTRSAVPVAQLPSDWGPHFTVIGIPVSSGSDRLVIWPRGTYDLEIDLAPGPVTRTIWIDIQTVDAEIPISPDERTR